MKQRLTRVLCYGVLGLFLCLAGCSSTPSSVTEGDTGSISGMLYRANGDPAAGMTVELYQSSKLGISSWSASPLSEITVPIASTLSDDQGEFLFEGLPFDSYTIIAENDSQTLQGYYEVQLSVSSVVIGGLQFLENGTVSGNVTLEDDESPLGVTIFIPGTTYSAHADSDGHFTMSLPEGTYTLYMMKTGYSLYQMEDVSVSANAETALDSVVMMVDSNSVSQESSPSWLKGEGAPSDGLGEDGDFYLDTENNILYLNVSGDWVLQTSLGGAGQDGQDGEDGVDGLDGENGVDGVDGNNGVDGQDGQNGNSLYVVYSSASDGTDFETIYSDQTYMGLLSTTNIYTTLQLGDLDKSVFTWVRFTGEGSAGADGEDGEDGTNGVDGEDGADGLSVYVVYSDSSDGTGFSAVYTSQTYIGLLSTSNSYTALSLVELDKSEFTWIRFVGTDGEDGENGSDGATGEAGEDGASSYFYVAYSDYSDGTDFSVTYTDQTYMGTLTTANAYNSEAVALLSKTLFTWVRIKGLGYNEVRLDSTDNSDDGYITLNVTLDVSSSISRIELFGGYDDSYDPVRLGWYTSYSSSTTDFDMGATLYGNFQVRVVDINNNASLMSYPSGDPNVNRFYDSSVTVLDMAYDDNGTLYVLVFTGSKYDVIQTDATLRTDEYTDRWSLDGADSPTEIECSGDTIFVVDEGLNKLFYFDNDESAVSVNTTFDGDVSSDTFADLKGISVVGDKVYVGDDGTIRIYDATFINEYTEIEGPSGVTFNGFSAISDTEVMGYTAQSDLYIYTSSEWTLLDSYGEELTSIGDIVGFSKTTVSFSEEYVYYYAIVSDQDSDTIRIYYLEPSNARVYSVFKTRTDTIGTSSWGDVYAPTRVVMRDNQWAFLRGDNQIHTSLFFKRVNVHVIDNESE